MMASSGPTAADCLLIATGNAGKLREVRSLLETWSPGDSATAGEVKPARWSGEIVGLDRFPDLPPAVESADTFAGNAAIKATHFSSRTGLITLADDSGLAVDALEGRPGVYSARYAGEHATDVDNNRKLMEALSSVPSDERSARFCCAMAVAIGDEVVLTAYGVWEGQITTEAHGEFGFGYDPYFLVPNHGKTAAELPPEVKNAESHRGKALRTVLPALVSLIATHQH
ncbi:MAG: RdgB/HAM1 family non-canonical purine NTP pyrophosphatase [Phycisphaerae bacterium]